MRQRDDLRADRIQVNVSHQAQKVLVLVTEDSLIPALKEVADLAVLPVEVTGIGEVYKLHYPGERCRRERKSTENGSTELGASGSFGDYFIKAVLFYSISSVI